MSTTVEPHEVLLTVIVPVFNQESEVAENVDAIRQAVAAGLGAPFELIVVSDGSIDRTAERMLEEAGEGTRVIRYDRNLGKGYAVKVGALEASGRYVAYIDADLDLDPSSLPRFVEIAERERLHFAIGSKRHPESDVYYPRSRRVASWLYQQLVRVLFRLDVRDTQVGIKVFHRDVAEQVVPLLLVKRFAFDLELLAVSRAFGFARIKELPIRLEYRFTGSGVRSLAVLRALVDTAAIFYRLRILRYYQRKRRIVGRFGWTRPRQDRLRVAVVGEADAVAKLDYPSIELSGRTAIKDVAERTRAEALAVLEPGAVPAGNWLSATVPFLSRPEIGAVVTPAVAPGGGDPRARASAAIRESRIGGGSQYFRFLPGNVRYVQDYPTETLVVRTELVRTMLAGVEPRSMCAELAAHGVLVLYTPEATVAARPARLFHPHLEWVLDRGRGRGVAVRSRGLRAMHLSSLPPLALALFALAGWPLLLVGGVGPILWLVLWGLYVAVIVLASAIASLRFRSLRVAALALPGFALTHAVYAVGFVAGVLGR